MDLIAEFEDLFCGRRLNGGSARRVHVFKPDPTLVIKIEDRDYASFQNVMEWEVWRTVQWDEEAKLWLAPCEKISKNGRVLLQRRTEPIRLAELPLEVPDFLTDLQHDNWGMFEGRPVMHDYGYVHLNVKKDLVKIRWNDGYGHFENEGGEPVGGPGSGEVHDGGGAVSPAEDRGTALRAGDRVCEGLGIRAARHDGSADDPRPAKPPPAPPAR